ncbi:enkurin domain-containing protein 1 isoform X2 [Carettochelys insculpta]|uniref:enkurin domain-containing protein 1 isoform X2 n=1 Tax=Carettochelys insculpta TaxID=44489 RepID=UPI003EBC1154
MKVILRSRPVASSGEGLPFPGPTLLHSAWTCGVGSITPREQNGPALLAEVLGAPVGSGARTRLKREWQRRWKWGCDCQVKKYQSRGRLEGNALKLDFLSGPLAPDPSLYPTCYSARPAHPAPRIRPDGQDALEKGRKGMVGVLLQLEGISLHREPPLKRRECKDHEKENLRRMREIQRRCKEKELAREHSQPKPVKALWKCQKYETVDSKVKARLQESSPPPKLEAQKFLRAYSRCGSGVQPRRSLSPSPAKTRAVADTEAAGGESTDAKIQVEGTSIDFIRHNARTAKQVPLRRSRSLQSLAEALDQKRREEENLLERKDHWRRELEEQRRNLPDPDMPPGHTMMPESKRLETLNSLTQSQEQLLKDLVMLPVRADTLSIQKRRAELEKKLSQIDEALKIFSRPKVFIKLDS